jgi:ATP-dependent DNA ligase
MTQQWQRWKNIQKCYPFEEKRLAKWEPPYLVQPKYDGFRCRAVPLSMAQELYPGTSSGAIDVKSQYVLLSSEENIVFSVPHLNIAIAKLGLNDELDGELYCHGLDFNAISSIVSRTVNLHPNYEQIQFHLFDVVNELPQIKRLTYIDKLRGLSPLIQVAPVYICNTLEDVLKAYDKIINLGYEGIIVRHYLAPYERKRSTWVMKFKPKQEDEYEICGFNEEIDKEGNPKDTLGALVCSSGDGNIFNVGTGFSDERRRELWEGRDFLIGQVAKVKYQHITSGNKVPRFPVFVEVKVRT